jgi:alpha-D-ribose 1-methylphosphonate 5-triphosphate diphosphatase
MSGAWAVVNARVVAGLELIDDAMVVVEDGRIVDVGHRRAAPPVRIDANGAFCLPGLVDSHSDGLEKEIRPRPTAVFEIGFALRAFEARLRGVGVTTVFHGIGYQEKSSYDRTIAQAIALHDAIDERQGEESPVDHRVLYRLEARTEGDLEPFLADLARRDHGGVAPLVSFEDHSPGQGQYRDVEQFRRAISEERIPAGMDVDAYVEMRLAETAELAPLRERKLAELVGLAGSGAVRLLAHDCEDASQVDDAHGWGAAIAEFPLTVEAARAARSHGMDVVMGAPNVLRGGSHSGNVAAAELVSMDLCTGLASDYQPATLMAAVFRLASESMCSLPRAVALVTDGPASLAGLADRGRIEAGRRADLVLVQSHGRWPQVIASWRSDGPAGRAGLALGDDERAISYVR